MRNAKILFFLVTTFASLLTFAVDVTFRVDMAQQTVAPEGVHIAGSFQDWNPESTVMTLESGSIYAYTTSFESGEYIEYKFVNGDAWGEDESVPLACNQNNNRFLTVPETNVVLDAVCFGSCDPCGDPAEVTFQVDMSEQLVSAMGVHIAGSFQGWNAGSTELTLIEDNIYGITVTVSENDVLEFKYINGNDWSGEEIVPESCGVPNGVGGFNRSYTVPAGGGILPVVCFSSCDPCNFIPIEIEVTFQVDMSEETISPDGVHIVGAFQEWDPDADEMTDIGNSVYEATFTLIAGNVYQYKFINGNTWEDEEMVPEECGVDNGQGGYNRYINVPEEDIVLEDVCYASCDPCDYVPIEVEVTFRVDMSDETISGNGVYITGAFQDWDPGSNSMTDVGNSVYEATFTLIAGEYYQYKFINGNTWDDEEIVPEACGDDNGQGGYNRFINVPEEDIILEDVCFSSCDPCSVGTGENFESSIDPLFVAISPNPFSNSLKIQYTLTEHADVKISIINVYGQILVNTKSGKLDAGEYVYHPAIESLSQGIYFCRFEVELKDQVYSELKKIIKQ